MSSATQLQHAKPQRLLSLDAFRGFTMIAMASGGLGLRQLYKNHPKNETLEFISQQLSHVPWEGWVVWDLIQPAFMFMVGVSMAYSYASRQAKGDSYASMFRHAAKRALVLILLGVFLRSNHSSQTNWTFTDVLSQIGYGYLFLFLLWNRKLWIQILSLLFILIGYWTLFAVWPLPGADFDYASAGVSQDWEYNFTGFAAHWNKNTNPAHFFDIFFLNLFPRSNPFTHNSGGYHTLSFIPSLGTMLLGLLCGQILRKDLSQWKIFGSLVFWSILLTAAGWALGEFEICPVVKRIWTPSWALFSTGLVMMILAIFYLVIDIVNFRFWAWPGIIVGMNSIAFYVINALSKNWITKTIQTHFGQDIYQIFGTSIEPVTIGVIQLLSLLLIALWMYRQRIFIRI